MVYDDSKEQPPSWPTYHNAPPDATFALGVISATYPKLETAFEQVFTAVTDVNIAFTTSLIPKIGNDVRIKLVEEALSVKSFLPHIEDAIRYFLKAYASLAFNRNMLMHSQILGGGEDVSIFLKSQRDGKIVGCILTVSRLRQIADEMEVVRTYGEALSNHIRAPRLNKGFADAGLPQQLWPLPDKPVQPIRLEYSATPYYPE
jgi:hypothetical protein